jgi:hypothetical protein
MQADDARYWLLATQATDTLWGSKISKYVSYLYTWNPCSCTLNALQSEPHSSYFDLGTGLDCFQG